MLKSTRAARSQPPLVWPKRFSGPATADGRPIGAAPAARSGFFALQCSGTPAQVSPSLPPPNSLIPSRQIHHFPPLSCLPNLLRSALSLCLALSACLHLNHRGAIYFPEGSHLFTSLPFTPPCRARYFWPAAQPSPALVVDIGRCCATSYSWIASCLFS
ncbi:hypothetical protein BGW36DRAFT_45910 [Talaromyces proteolyticus]|uniref:Uncharacterized protein n=1 Tax=Talaromyces proteolyticus TaxID=1131652 RepID=A0AAD4KHF6_9EURO|nr:uncharacterized protein BGW36DRAFT_45910 [Talaromyces proteolyticus]KAH8692418.1 hypothetical protein BGW36DRAFT_45910 [Talaromyces proteolyticus]